MKTVFALVVAAFSFGNVAFAQFADPLGPLDTYQSQKKQNVVNQMADVDAQITALGNSLNATLSNDILLYIQQENMSDESLFMAEMYNYALGVKNNAVNRRAAVQTEFNLGAIDSSNGRVCRLLGLDMQAMTLFYRAIAHYSFCESELMQIYMDLTFADGIVKFIRTKVPYF